MNNSSLYIPKTIKVGFQERKDAFTKKLAYVIYTDDAGKLRKETSWQSWRDKKIEPEDYKNEPTSGFMLNRDIKRYNWSHFSSNRSYFRVHDPRGFEFEITPENLLGILMEGDCTRRLLDGEFVYAWDGTQLALLPVKSEAYEAATKFTTLQAGKIGVKNLVPGMVYRTKKMTDLVYIGKFPWFSRNTYDLATQNNNSGTPKFVFYELAFKKEKNPNLDNLSDEELDNYAEETTYSYRHETDGFVSQSSLSNLAGCVSQEPVANYAELMDRFNKITNSSRIKEVVLTPLKEKSSQDHWYGGFVETSPGTYVEYKLWSQWLNGSYQKPWAHPNNQVDCSKTTYVFSPEKGFMQQPEPSNTRYSYYATRFRMSWNELLKLEAKTLKLKFENGKIIRFDKLSYDW